ncbi:MAG: hypothetical protein ABSE89_07025 [Sedimentisphaerales bacterium]
MIDSEKTRRFGLDKVAFLLLLLAGLLIAKLIVSSRGSFKLSKPVMLGGCGVSVSVPTGAGFQVITDGFEYNDNEFRLSSAMQISNDAVVKVNWRYFIVPFKRTTAERFEEQAAYIDGNIEKTGSEKFGQLTFDYARIVSSKNSTLLLSATTLLPDGRTLSLEVAQKGRDVNLVDKIFRSLTASATFTPDNPLANGKKLINDFKNKTLADLIRKRQQQNFFFIQNYTDSPIGFTTDAIAVKTDKPRFTGGSLIAANLYLLKVGVQSFAEQSLLRGEPNLQSFKWVSRQSDLLINRQTTTSIELDKEDKLTIRSEKIEQTFTSAPTIIPDILMDFLIESFLQSDFNSVMVDTLLSDGRVIPAVIAKARKQQYTDPNISFAVDIQFLGMDGGRQATYFDKNGQILKSEVHGKISYKLEKTDKEHLISVFPDWREKLGQIGQYIFEENKN